MKKSTTLTVLLMVSLAIKTYSQTICEQILRQGIFDYYEMKSEVNYDYAFKKLMVMSKEQIEQQIRERTLDFSIPIPFAESFLNFAFGASDYQERYKKIKEFYLNNTETNISYDDRIWMYSKVANRDIVKAWESCVTNPKEVFLEVTGDIKTEFSITLTYKPSTGLSRNTSLSGVSQSSGLQKVGQNVFFTGKRIRQFNAYTQQFKRIDSSSVSLVLNVVGFPNPLTISFPSIPKPLPVYEIRWFNADESGKPYYVDHTIQTDNCGHYGRCCGCQRNAVVSLSQLKVTNARITDVNYQCYGSFCGWSYHPSGGYGKCVSIAGDGQSFQWWRLWDGGPVTEVYRVYYEKPRGVCVRNCSDVQFLTK